MARAATAVLNDFMSQILSADVRAMDSWETLPLLEQRTYHSRQRTTERDEPLCCAKAAAACATHSTRRHEHDIDVP
jgi:hypothetical protein